MQYWHHLSHQKQVDFNKRLKLVKLTKATFLHLIWSPATPIFTVDSKSQKSKIDFTQIWPFYVPFFLKILFTLL